MKIKPELIIGLGNPGEQYKNTYHNVGFLATDFFAENPPNSKLLKSEVYMNESGAFVAKTLKKYGIRPEELLVIHDDSDIELGKYKFSFGRGSAGHKGAESVIKTLRTKNFRRLRIGIRKNISINQPFHQRKSAVLRRKASEIVLKKITKKDLTVLNKVFQKIEAELSNPKTDVKLNRAVC